MEPGGEEPLDDAVVQVAGDAIAIIEHLETSSSRLQLCRRLQSLGDVTDRRYRRRNLTDRRAQCDLDWNLVPGAVPAR